MPILSSREQDVAILTAAGLSNREIAEALGISDQTTRNHLVNIFRKLAVKNRVHLTLLMLHKGKPDDAHSRNVSVRYRPREMARSK